MTDQVFLYEDFLREWGKGEGITACTSGSTGTPKTISLPMEQVMGSARRTNEFFKITRDSQLHSAVSFRYIGGKMMIARSLIAGCRLTFSEPSLEPQTPSDETKIDLMAVVPAQMPYILEHLNLFGQVENFLIGGSAIDDRLWDKIARSGLKALESYGMTETASHIALRPIEGPAYSRPGFAPLPGIRLDINEDNCLIIHDRDIRVETNDIVKFCPNGSFEVLGRKDDVIVTGGIKVMPQELEQILKPFLEDLASDFYVSSLPDERWTAKLVLRAVPIFKGNDSVEKERIRLALDSIPEHILPKRLRPKEVLLIDSLPLTDSGKLNRN